MDAYEILMVRDNDLDDSSNTRVKQKMHMGLQFPFLLSLLRAKFYTMFEMERFSPSLLF